MVRRPSLCTSFSLLGLTIAAVFISGCGGQSQPESVAASGSLHVGEKPLEYGMISFLPNAEGKALHAVPVQQGRFLVPKDAGLLPGEYRVSVEPYEPEFDEFQQMSVETRRQIAASRVLLMKAGAEKTRLDVRVAAAAAEDVVLDLKLTPTR
jgi:hypothetical protein